MKNINVLTIAGTDPSGGAGIQADLKTFSALGAYGCSVVTALTAQNTYGVQSIYDISADFVKKQLESILDDIRIDSGKIGMLATSDIVEVVADILKIHEINNFVLDTVILSTSGNILIKPNAISTLCNKLFPQVAIITPNISESAILLDSPIASNENEVKEQGYALLGLGVENVLITGGHFNNSTDSPDWLFTNNEIHRLSGKRIYTKNIHGTGCTLSAALAALYPVYRDWVKTVRKAKDWLNLAISKSNNIDVGHGNGPVHHFYEWW